jgi:phage tail sheath gpL-like
VIFNQIPSTIRTPGSFIEYDASKARPITDEKPSHILVIATKLSAGTATVETVAEVTGGSAQADALGGVGSPAAEMLRAVISENPESDVSLLCATEPSGGTAAGGTLVWTGPATADGYIYVYVAGVLVTPVRVLSGTTAAAVATAVYNAINAQTRLPISATNGTAGTTTLVAKWKGVAGNDILVETNRLGTEAYPTGIGCTVTTMASGAGVPVIATTIAAIGAEWYDRIVSQFNDDATMDALETEALARCDAGAAIDAIVYAGYRGTYVNTAAYGAARNSQVSSVAEIELSPTAPWIAAANYAAVDSTELDPARPLNGLALRLVVPPKKSQRFTRTQRDALLHVGMSTTKVANDIVVIERAVTTYQTNAAALADDTYLELMTPKTLAYLRWSANAWLAAKFPRSKLADDDTRADPSQPIATPEIIRGELISWGKAMEKRGLIEDLDAFVAGLIVERATANPNDPNRVNYFFPPNLVNGCHILAGKMGFIV